ncbi:MAG: helix-turn-helix transcriptional regulator [Phycisphaerales bacterium]
MSSKDTNTEYLRGTLELAVLALLAEKPDHGYGVMKRMRDRSEGALEVAEGTLYPVLHKLAKQGILSYSSQRTEANRVAKVYELTTRGEGWLAARRDGWDRHVQFIASILNGRHRASRGEAACE